MKNKFDEENTAYNERLSSLDGLEAGNVIKEKMQLIGTIDNLTKEVSLLAEQQDKLLALKNSRNLLERVKAKMREKERSSAALRNFFKPVKRNDQRKSQTPNKYSYFSCVNRDNVNCEVNVETLARPEL